ncbi:hypothetical protein C4J81_12790 [Deltaproteobacteria bacterium Smac51]|nr:hypothetical protein C4J81_12790 [Deltaproteobacteria bacterium Smac51]
MLRILYNSIFVMAMSLAVCALAPQAVYAAEVDRIVAVVNGEIITLRQVDNRVNSMTKSGRLKGANKDDLRKKVLEALVEQELVNQAAKSRGIVITPADVNQAIEAIKKENKITDAQLRASLTQSGTSMDAFRDDLTVELLRNRVMGSQIASKIVVTDKEVLAVLSGEGPPMESSGLLGNFSANDHLPVRIIVIPADPSNKKGSLAEARRIKKEIEDGLSFAEAAGMYSKGPGADNGGDTGEGLVVGQLHPNLKAAVANLAPGTPSDPVDMGNAFVILTSVQDSAPKASAGKGKNKGKLADYPPEQVESARRQLERYKMQQRYVEWLNDLKSKAIVRINL